MRLDLEGVGAGRRGGVEQFRGERWIAVVIDPRFGDDEAWLAGSDFS